MTEPSITEKLDALRAKGRENLLSLEDMREALKLMRGDRVRAAAVSKTSRAKKVAVNSDDLLSELGELPE